MTSKIKTLKELLDTAQASGSPGLVEREPEGPWQLRAIQSDDCLSYVAWNTRTREALLIDPKEQDVGAYRSLIQELSGYRWLAVIDTHTHADHVSAASLMSKEIGAPLVMHAKSPSERVDLRVAHDTRLPAQDSPIQIWLTPGHTPDGMTVLWGPYIFAGDTVLFGDSGRDDLPGGDPVEHYESIQKLKVHLKPAHLLLPGHDHKGGRSSSWKSQLETNASLFQPRDEFIKECEAFDGQPPKDMKRALKLNFR